MSVTGRAPISSYRTTTASHPLHRSYRNLPDALLDYADQVETLPDGRLRRRWHRRTVWDYADTRTGRQSTGRTPGTTGPRKPHWYADDGRLDAEDHSMPRRGLAGVLASQLNVPTRTAQRILAAADTKQVP
jgi:hypothetical protein